MKTILNIILGWCLLLGTFGLHASEMVEWTAHTGHSMRGAFVQLQGQQLTLRAEDSSERVVNLNLLSPESRALALRIAKNPPIPGLLPPESKDTVEYRGDNYLLRLSPARNFVELFILSPENKILVAPITVHFIMARRINGAHDGVRLTDTVPIVSDEPGLYRWEGRAESEGPVRFEVRSAPDHILIGYQVVLENPASPIPLGVSLHMWFPPTLTFEEGRYTLVGTETIVEQAEIEDLLKDHRIDLKITGEGRTRKIPFNDYTDRSTISGMEKAEIKGMFHPYTLRYSSQGRTGVSANYYSYDGQKPSSGFRLSMSKDEHDSPTDSVMLRIDLDQ